MNKQELKTKYIEEMKKHQHNGDIESAHGNADDDLCNLLRDLGFGEVVEEYLLVDKWYA